MILGRLLRIKALLFYVGQVQINSKIFSKSCNVIGLISLKSLRNIYSTGCFVANITNAGVTTDWLSENTDKTDKEDTFLRSLVATTLLSQNIRHGIKGLSTKGGLNERLRKHMDEKGAYKYLIDGLQRLNDSIRNNK